ncbi:MAG: thiol:disulfide interchange protein DsbA/DsbL [Chromatiales bacterium]|nr:thiol:disulfide interchange protein DsbA/DsbL [Chromatiales bacterium]
MTSRRIICGLLLALLCGPASALDEDDIMGMHERLSPPQPTADPSKVEVLEVFWYKCPHCFRFQNHILRYESTKPDYVDFQRLPAVVSDAWKPQAQAYYTAVALKGLDNVHGAMFGAIHVDGQKMDTTQEVRALFVRQGLDGAKFDKHFKSFGVDSMVRRAQKRSRSYGIRSVPTVIINGRYRTSAQHAGSFEQAIAVIETLVELERKRMGIEK